MNTENKYYKEAYVLFIEELKKDKLSAHQISQALTKPNTKEEIQQLALNLEKLQTYSPTLLKSFKEYKD